MTAGSDDHDVEFMRAAIALAARHMREKEGGPFGAIVVRGTEIIGRGWNRVTGTNDPTAHAEIVAIREAAAALGSFSLAGCVLYASCEPCPMCLAAACWARVERIVFAADRNDAAAAGFDDAAFYAEMSRPPAERRLRTSQALRPEALRVFDEWRAMPDKILY
jgi:tRNA(Arg) A34 adenosine deaminase TadA